jgi:hypothetical protein
VLPTDPSLATLSPLSQHHDIPPALPPSILHSQTIPTKADLSSQPPGPTPPSLSQSPQDPRLSPRTPEQDTSFGRSLHEADFDLTKNNSTSSNHHKSFHQHLGYQNDTSSSQIIPDFSYEGQQPQIRQTSLLTSSPHSTSSSQESAGPGPLVQILSQHIPSRSRRKHNRQFKCTSCSKVFPRRCDLKYVSSHPRLEV